MSTKQTDEQRPASASSGGLSDPAVNWGAALVGATGLICSAVLTAWTGQWGWMLFWVPILWSADAYKMERDR